MFVQMTFFIFMLFGIAALTLDMGYVRLTQNLMQNAVDSAALEGLRQRNNPNDSARRVAAKQMLDRAFVDPAGERNLGAGPELTFDAPANEFNANQHYEIPATPFYIPNVQSNLNDCVNGDMVAGAYAATADHTEANDYTRADYTPVVNGNCTNPPDSSALAAAPSFLVRLRRTIDAGGTYDPDGLDNQANISSSGSTLPMLFGRAGVLESMGTHIPRRDGFAVRATAIANVANVVQAGPARFGRRGLAPFAVDKTCWRTLTGGVEFMNGAAGQLDGDVCSVNSAHCIATAQAIAVGDPPPNVGSGCISDGPVYVPIYDSGLGAVIGFGYANTASVFGAFTMTPIPNQIATGNASAALHRAVSSAVINSAEAMWAVSRVGSLLAPVLAR